MEIAPQPKKGRLAICGLLSIAAPIVGAAIGSATRQGDWGDFFNSLAWIGYGSIAGVILAVTGIIRHERPRVLPWLTLLFNAVPCFLIFTGLKW